MERSWRIAAITLFTSALLLGGLAGDKLLALSDGTRADLKLYTELVDVAHDRYAAPVTYKDLVYNSIQGMIRTLDPHSNFLVPEDYEGMKERHETSYYGLGVLVGIRNGLLTVISPLDGSPAAKVGVQPGDVIAEIEGEPTEPLTMDEAILKLKGPKDTQVHITIQRRGLEQPLHITVTRAEIPQNSVRQAYMLTPDTGYIQISSFARGTGRETSDAIEKLQKLGMKRLLLDLRNNGGGLLDPSIETSELFLPEGSSIVETRGRTRDSDQVFRATDRHQHIDIPVVVLVNEGTASGAEIVAGAVQDHDRGILVGTPSWGKGLVQTLYPLSYGTGLALTTAKYYTPSGRLIQRDYKSFFDYYSHQDAGSPEVTGKPAAAGQEFKTDIGRKVYGGGGITPDLIVQDETLTLPEQFFLVRNAFANFATDYLRRQKVASTDWKPSPEVLKEFREWLVRESVATGKEADEALAEQATRDYSLLMIRAEVMNIAFGQEARHKALTEGDVQAQKALAQFDRAAELLAEHKAKEKEKEIVAQRQAPAGKS
jgi:carboxyl-terminal processing protease